MCDLVAQIPLNSDFTVFCRPPDPALDFQMLAQSREIFLCADKTLDKRNLFACAPASVDAHYEFLLRGGEGCLLFLPLLLVFEVRVGGEDHAQTLFPIIICHSLAKIANPFVYLQVIQQEIMNKKNFRLWNYFTAATVFVISAVTYLSTIEPTASFWDCGEFIASSYKLEVGHPPGNPVFQLFARVCTLFGDNMHAAVLVNSMSALCSALTIFLLYFTIVFFAKRLVGKQENGEYSLGGAIIIFGSAAVGALVYCFSDTFWFSAVEGEVYAMSSLFTALVVWAMTKWYDEAELPRANRWIVFICFMMGLSIGIHLLNLLAIPALVFMYYYRMREDGKYSMKALCGITLLSFLIIALLFFFFVPYFPKLAAYVDLFSVNVLGMPYNVGAAFFLLSFLGLCFWGLFRTMRKGKVFLNTLTLCVTTITIGFSLFSIDVIRSSVKTPTNEYQPDNAFTLVRYLSREQYGKTPLLYGQYFDAPYDLKEGTYWAPVGGKYKKVPSPIDADYKDAGKMLFPRMWSSDAKHVDFYLKYTGGKGKRVAGATYPRPSFGDNLKFFFDYQLNWMYWRYFMWNFAGRQNDIHSPVPGDIFNGNWECGIKAIDDFRLGDQTDAPAILKENKAKNHYYLLPLLLGLLGLFFQFDRDKRGTWLVFLLFFMTGIAIVLYLNQPPYQVRERDYAYAGSFYAFTIWIGLGVAALYSWINEALKGRGATAVASLSVAACLFVPALMAAQNWDDHNRSNRYTSTEIATNYLNSAGTQGILITHGDNDTFPLWYAQEVENIRTDVRICNTSLLGTDWHIDQMKYAVNESKPLPLNIGPEQYLYGTNEIIHIYEAKERVLPLKDVIAVFKDPRLKIGLSSGKKVDYIISRKFTIPVDKDNVIKYGILDEKYRDIIPDEITLEIPKGKDYLTKPELFMLDLLSDYRWDRPLHFLNMGGDLNVGIKDYLMYEGYSCKFIPIKNKISSSDAGFVDTDHMYELMHGVYKHDALCREDYFIDYQNYYTFMGVMNLRTMFSTAARAFVKAGEPDRAKEMLDKSMLAMRRFPLCGIPFGFTSNDLMVLEQIRLYYSLGEKDKADSLAAEYWEELYKNTVFWLEFFDVAKDNFELCGHLVHYLIDELKDGGNTEFADSVAEKYNSLLKAASGTV